MYSYYTTTYSGRTIHIIKAQTDSTHDVCISVMAEKYDTADPLKLASSFSDGYLESNGYSKVGVINGGLFFISGSYEYANGIEKAFWTVHENDDSSLDNVMALGHSGDGANLPVIELQSSAKANLGSYRGALTGAFGLLRNGSVDQGNTSAQGAYSSVSGRSIIGKDASGTIYFIATPGVTGSSGLTGSQCVSLAQSLGLTDALALDGGGSVSLIYEGSWKVSTSREIKNVIGLYVKQKSTGGGTGGGDETPSLNFKDKFVPFFAKSQNVKMEINGQMREVDEIRIRKNNNWIPITKIERE